MTESEDSDESENSVEVKAKRLKFNPNVIEVKSHFTPGSATAFNGDNHLFICDNYVRKRKALPQRQSRISREESVDDSIDGNITDETIIDETYCESTQDCETTTDECDWRNGPAKYWYDLIKLPEDCRNYDYGLKRSDNCWSISSMSPRCEANDNDDAFNMVSQTSWEENVIWDPDVVRQQILKNIKKPTIAGWLPIDDKRSAPLFVKQMKVSNNNNNNDYNCVQNVINNSNKNSKLIDKIEEKAKIMSRTPINGFARSLRKRKLNNNNLCPIIENKSLNFSEQINKTETQTQWVSTLPEENRELILNRWEDQIIWDTEAMDQILVPKVIPFSGDDENAIIELNECMDEESNDSQQITEQFQHLVNDFNISNDEFYASVVKADNSSTRNLIISHSIPALRLDPLCFPTCVLDFSRPLLKKSKTLASKVEHKVNVCIKQFHSNEEYSESDSINTKDLSQYRIQSIAELTARNGDVILFEYSEEDPPFQMRIGMGSKIINYFKKTKDKSSPPLNHKFAETRIVSEPPFIGEIAAGKSQLALETNMFRSPIFEQNCPETDFLVIRTSDGYYIRECDGLFVVGQQLPIIEVPRPKSKTYFDFSRQLALMFIYRFFNGRKSVKNLDSELSKAFPNLTKHFTTRVLRDFTLRQGEAFLLKRNIPFNDQMVPLVNPESCCAFYSTTIAERKFRDMGLGDRLYLMNDDDDCDNDKLNELSFAPWNTTLSYISKINAKKWLNVYNYNSDGSLVFANQSYKEFKDQMPTIKRCQPVSDRSLKRMNLDKAHKWLIDYGMAREKVRKLKNASECHNLIKDLSEKLRQNGVKAGVSITQTTEQHYKFECQKVFDLHTSYYLSKENYSTDEEEEEETDPDSDLEDMGEFLEAMILENKTLRQIEFEREEQERKNLISSLKGIKNTQKDNKHSKRSFEGKVLKITRRYNLNGKFETRTEIVRQTEVIKHYVRIRETKSEDFIKNLSFIRNHTENGKLPTKSKSKTPVINGLNKQTSNLVKTVPNHSEGTPSTQEDSSKNHINGINDDWDTNDSIAEENLLLIEGSKLKFSKKVVIEAKEIEEKEKRRVFEEREAEKKEVMTTYFTPRSVNRCRIDPMVRMCDIFDKLIVEVRKLPELENIDVFVDPVNDKEVPDYREIIKNPMDLRTIRSKVGQKFYSDHQHFLNDIKLIYENSLEYNGVCDITGDAKKLYEYCVQYLAQRKDELTRLEKLYQNQFIN